MCQIGGHSFHNAQNHCCNHRDGEYFLHRITRKLWSTATSAVCTKLLPLTNYISGAENETQWALLRRTNGNIEMRSPSAAAMLTMVAAATIVRCKAIWKKTKYVWMSRTYFKLKGIAVISFIFRLALRYDMF